MYITGPTVVHKYDTVTYSAINATSAGDWYILENGERKLLEKQKLSITLDIVKKNGNFVLEFNQASVVTTTSVVIESF